MVTLGELERAVMEALWEHGAPMTVREVVRVLADRDPAYTTVMTVLDRLAKKRFVSRARGAGRAWWYVAVASRESYIAQLMLDALAQTGDRDAALTHFAHAVSIPDARVLRRALEAGRGKPDEGCGQ